MKRKRGYKKGKGKKPMAADLKDNSADQEVVTVDDSTGDEEEKKDGNADLGIEVPKTESATTYKVEELLSPELVHQKPIERKVQVVYGRVRVKLKSAKPAETVTSVLGSGALAEADKSSREQVKSSLEKEEKSREEEKSGVKDMKEVMNVDVNDNSDSSPDIMLSALGQPPKKSGGIKIKAPVISSINVVSNSPRIVENETPPPKKQKLEVKYDKRELDSALEVITKVMKMDAAEPFNAPVDPVALGIPDYFDVIETPMDFGTVCNNIRSGTKYKNSEEVFKDVRYIWDNCYKYNNKGDYIVDLMKRVKKNFTKYWQAAGLYNDGADHSQVRDGATSSHRKIHVNSSSSKYTIKKRPGFRRHKDGCLCAVCVLKRRRIENEGQDSTQSIEEIAKGLKPQGASPGKSPFGGETSSNLDSQSQNPDSDAEMNGMPDESERGNVDQRSTIVIDRKDEDRAERNINESFLTLKDSKQGCVNEESGHIIYLAEEAIEPASVIFADPQEDTKIQPEDPMITQQRKQQEAEEKKKRIKALTKSFNNPVLLGLCGTVFPDDPKSIWSGPHSLIRRKKEAGSFNSLHLAVESLLK